MKKKSQDMIKKIIIGLIVLITLGTAIYIMVNHLGLVDSLDFGAGAYYYADIPGFEKFVDGSHYQSKTPMWVLIALFLAWGAIMYRFWVFLEHLGKKD